MVAIVSGGNAGLDLNSLVLAGQRGTLGTAAEGQSGEQAFVNVANGNLVLQDVDALLTGRGLDVTVVRTYNSQGQFADDNNDAWWINGYRKIVNLTGTVNTAGSTVQRVGSDGAALTYTYDTASGTYKAANGSGKYDTLTYNAALQDWTWTEAATQNKETYSVSGATWRLTSARDANYNTTTFTYSGDLLASVTDANGEKVEFTYNGNLLAKESILAADGTCRSCTYYRYDDLDRLQQVKVDLSPEDASIEDGNVYVTSYSYIGSTNLVSSVTQADGTQLTFTYTNGSVASITDSLGRVTRFNYDTTNRETTVTDALGNQNVYAYDTGNRLTSVTGLAVNGIIQTVQYQYDSAGNLIKSINGEGGQVTYTYDSHGNQLSQSDSLGDRIERTYDANNLVLTGTIFRVPASGTQAASEPETTRYVYNSNGNLQFVIDAEGQVTAYRYNNDFGQRNAAITYLGARYDLSGLTSFQTPSYVTMTQWSNAQNPQQTTRVDYQYNTRGQLTGVTEYARLNVDGTGVQDGTQSTTTYSYDATGNLLLKVDANGNQTSFVYDGLNRLLSSTDALGHVTTNQYDDADHIIVHTQANGRVDTSVYDSEGQLLSSIVGGQAHTEYRYDGLGRLAMTVDPTGDRQYYLYDAAGNLSAQIDGRGGVTEYRYNALGQRVQTIVHAVPLTSVQIAALDQFYGGSTATAPTGTPNITLPAVDASDQVTFALYDGAGRLAKTVDAAGHVTEYIYDGAGNRIETIQHELAIDTAGLTVNSRPEDITPPESWMEDAHRTYYYYDKSQRLIGTVVASHDITQYNYDNAGRLVETVRYAYGPSFWLDYNPFVPFSSILNVPTDRDQHTHYLYDGEGRLTGTVDPEGYLTTQEYDQADNIVRSVRYANKVAVPVLPNSTVNDIIPDSSDEDQVTTKTYDELNRTTSITNPEGTTTTYEYDTLGNLVSSIAASGTTDMRALTQRFDTVGRLVGTLSGKGSALLASAQSQQEIDAIWQEYGTAFEYDMAGRRISSTDPNGNKTLYYYDRSGNLTHTINALGEVQERRFNALNQLTDTITYGMRLASSAGLTGGLLNSSLTNALAQIANSGLDSKTSYAYDATGKVSSMAGPMGAVTTYTYDAYGDEISRTETIDQTHQVTTWSNYDRRGLLLATFKGESGQLIFGSEYDAFGRAQYVWDANGNTTERTFDRLGRIVEVIDQSEAERYTTYDAFGRVLTQTDANGNTTSYSYDAANRAMTVHTPEGVQMTVTHNRFGQDQSIVDGNGNITTYSYDEDGRLVGTTKPLTQTSSEYDKTGHLIRTIDANGKAVSYTYDAVGRLLTRTVDPDGLALTTTYQYDAKEQRIAVTDTNGVVTATSYDLAGRVVTQIVDPDGLHLVTSYTYDERGDLLTVTDPKGQVTQYVYDELGRRIETHVDPAGLNLVTSYTFDGNGNVTSVTDPLGNETRYLYDVNDRLVYTVDGAGYVSKRIYDAEGHLIQTLAFATAIDIPGLLEALSAEDPDAPPVDAPTIENIDAIVVSDPARDIVSNRVYDHDGKLRYVIDGTGAVTQLNYDSNGNVVERIGYVNRIDLSTWIPGEDPQVTRDVEHDTWVRTVYDTNNRAIFSVDGTGALTQTRYDGNGNVIETIAYADPIPTDVGMSEQDLMDAAGQVNDPSRDQHIRNTYDAANRLTWSVNSVGAVTHNVYDNNGNLVKKVAYATEIVPDADPQNVTTSDGDRVTVSAYDAANRLTYSVNALGGVTKQIYDANGNLVQRIAYALPIDQPTADGAIPSLSDIAGAIQSDTVNDRGMRWAYDKANRAVFAVDGQGSVSEMHYDGDGRVTSVLGYAKPIATDQLPEIAAPADIQSLLMPDAANDRRTQSVYDAAGRLVYSIDAQGYVRQTDYDGTGQITRTTLYASAIPSGTPATPQDVGAALQSQPAYDQVNQFSYDVAGHLVRSVDADGNAEEYTYDGVGNKLSFTNKSGATWHYDYDAHGRVISETAPPVAVTRLTTDAAGNLLVDEASSGEVAIVTRMSYDALGNLQERTEAANLPESRTTRYEYDALGRQVRTIYPPVPVYDSSADDLATNGANGSANRTDTTRQLDTEITYDALGNAVASRDVMGNYSYKAYDKLGRVAYNVDALGYVTGYIRNVYGEATALTRYANALDVAPDAPELHTTESIASALSGTDHSADRTIITDYDRLGRAIQVAEPQTWVSNGTQGMTASRITRNSFDAFGNLVRHAVLADAQTDTWAIDTYYYDANGRRTASIDALGYVTQQAYDAAGNLKSIVEYGDPVIGATPDNLPLPASSDADRTTRYAYDRLNRKTSETRVDVQFSDGTDDIATGNRSRGDVTTTYRYDAVGNLTVTTDALDGSTYSYHDALGRLVAVAAPTGNPTVDGAAVTPLTVFRHDAYGNIVARIDHANGAQAANEDGFAAGTASVDDRLTLTSYDLAGDAVQTTDADGVSTFASYDEKHHVRKQWLAVTGNDGVAHTMFTAFEYDALGRRTATITPGSNVTINSDGEMETIDQSDAGVVRSDVGYNGFGEVIWQSIDGSRQEYFDYDNAGRLWRTNSGDGIDKVMLYDLQGHRISLLTSAGMAAATVYGDGNPLATVGSAEEADQLQYVRRTDTLVDLLGRNTDILLPQRDGQRPAIHQTFDRWGNVLTRSNLNGPNSYTAYRYNDFNQVIFQSEPDGDGGQSGDSPVTELWYDRLGREIALRDPNGNVNRQLWDADGSLAQEIHANGGIVTHYRNAFGEETASRDAENHLTTYERDHLGRIVETQSDPVGRYEADSQGNVTGGTQRLISTTQYDQAGRILAQTNGNGETTRYDVDLRGNVTAVYGPLGQADGMEYDVQGRRIAHRDANGAEESWHYDDFGHLQSRRDLGGEQTDYDYDSAGQRIEQTSTRGQDIRYRYDEAGQVKQIRDLAEDKTTQYEYDLAGRHTRELTVQHDVLYQDKQLAYDSQGRLARLESPIDHVSVTLDYDRAGNLIHQREYDPAHDAATVHQQVEIDGVTHTVSRILASLPQKEQDLWYAYDSMNRQVLVDGAANGNADDASNLSATQGHRITYDKNGNRLSDIYQGRQVVAQTGAGGQVSYVVHEGLITLYYQYDQANRLVSTAVGALDAAGNALPASQATVVEVRRYDGAGRLVQSGPGTLPAGYVQAAKANPQAAYPTDTTTRQYDGNGRLLTERVTDVGGVLRREISYAGGYDAAGNILSYTVTDANGTVTTTQITQIKFDDYKRAGTTTTTVKADGTTGTATSEYAYDVNGLLTGIDSTGANAAVTQRLYANDANGHILQTSDGAKAFNRLILDSQVYAVWDPPADGTPPASDPPPASVERVQNFDESGNAIVPVRSGDTLQSLAQAAYGDAKLWYLIAEANGIAGNSGLSELSSIIVPSRGSPTVQTAAANENIHIAENDDFWQIIPSHGGGGGGGGCGGIGKILMVVVAVVVTVYTAGAAAAAFAPAGTMAAATTGFSATMTLGGSVLAGTAAGAGVGLGAGMAAAAVGGAVGSIASQGVGIATGAQDSFSWKGVALSAISAGTAAGAGQVLTPVMQGVSPAVQVAAKAAVTSTVTQGVAVATGMQESFSWTGVAASAVAAGTGAAVGGEVSDALQGSDIGSFGKNLITGTASGLAAGVTTAALKGGGVSVIQVATDAFSNALGNSIVDGIGGPSQSELDLQRNEGVRDAAMFAALGGSTTQSSALGGGLSPFVSGEPGLRFRGMTADDLRTQADEWTYARIQEKWNSQDVMPSQAIGITMRDFDPDGKWRPDSLPMDVPQADAKSWLNETTNWVGGKVQAAREKLSQMDPEDYAILSPNNARAAAQYWADRHVQTGNALYAIPGSLAAVWAEYPNEIGMVLSVGRSGFPPKLSQGLNRSAELAEIFNPASLRSGPQIGNRSLLEVPNNGNAKIYSGATEQEVKLYFQEVSGISQLPVPRPIPGKGDLYTVKTPQGNFNLRDFSTSSGTIGPAWTIDIPKGAAGTTYNPEIKFLKGTVTP